MSLELHAFLPTDEWPAIAGWQSAVSSLSLPLLLDPSLDLATATGFVPCRIRSFESGFEVWPEAVADVISMYPDIEAEIGESRRVLTFRWGGDLKEGACALAAAAGLVAFADARVYSPDDDVWYDIERLKSECAEVLGSLEAN